MFKKYILGILVPSAFILSLWGFDGKQPDWAKKLGYHQDEIHPISQKINGIPQVEVKVNGFPLWVIFDTGCSTGFSLTSAVEQKITHTVTGKAKALNPDGSYRGETKLATIASLEVFGQKYGAVKTSFTDWRMYSDVKFNGLLGLRYFQGKRITLDYKKDLIAVTDRPLPDSQKSEYSGASAALLEASGSQADLIYVSGRVRGRPTVIYLDTGSSASFIDPSMVEEREIEKGRRYLFVENVDMSIGDLPFTVKRLRVQEQRRGVKFTYPQTVKLGTDVINGFLITVDKISGKLYLEKN